MKNEKIYWASVEYHYNATSSHYGKFLGGVVYSFVKATTKNDAIQKLMNTLEQSGLDLIKLEFMSLYDTSTEWETKVQTSRYLSLYNEAKESNTVIFDEFYAYETDK